MKNWTILSLLFVAACSSVSKKPVEMGSLKGNVYWKYNNYVGNKPDAGSTIKLYSLYDTAYQETATCDVLGNYSIDSVPAGEYILIVASKTTNESPSDALTNTYVNGPLLKSIAKDSLAGLKTSWDSMTKLDHILDEYSAGGSALENLRIHRRSQDSMNQIASRWFHSIPEEALYRIGKITSTSPKVKYQLVTIKPKRVETVITDFGITYF
jgi:hypothetical protein